MAFLRFVVAHRHSDSGVEDGLFRLAYTLRDDPRLDEAARHLLAETLQWFDEHLRAPERFNRTRSKGYYRRATKGISWLRDTATEHVSRMHAIRHVLEAYGHPVTVVRETHVGYVVYEDEAQVVAEPFADTETGPLR